MLTDLKNFRSVDFVVVVVVIVVAVVVGVTVLLSPLLDHWCAQCVLQVIRNFAL